MCSVCSEEWHPGGAAWQDDNDGAPSVACVRLNAFLLFGFVLFGFVLLLFFIQHLECEPFYSATLTNVE